MKLYPEIIFKVNSNPETAGMVGGAKLFFIAKHYNRGGGSGIIHEKEFRNYFRRYVGLSRATYYRWRKQAFDLGLFEPGEDSTILLLSWGRAARTVGCWHMEKSVSVSMSRFACSQDLSEVWAGYMLRHEPKKATDTAPAQKHRPITKGTLRRITGVKERTQRRYDNKAGIEKKENHALICDDPVKNPETAISENGNGYYTSKGKHYKRLGNTHFVPRRIKEEKKGRLGKVNRELRAALSSMSGSEPNERSQRLYFTPRIKQINDKGNKRMRDKPITPDEQIKKAFKRLAKLDHENRPPYIFGYERTWTNKGLWRAHDVQVRVFA